MKYIAFIALLVFGAQAEENEELIDLMVTSKAVGMCGTITQMASFQEATKMDGGDEFIDRFLSTEMARLGKTLPQFIKECEMAISVYNNTIEALGFQR